MIRHKIKFGHSSLNFHNPPHQHRSHSTFFPVQPVASNDFLDGRPVPTASGSGTPTADEYVALDEYPPPPPATCGSAGLDLVLPELMGDAEEACWNDWSTKVGEDAVEGAEDDCCCQCTAKLMLLLPLVGVCIDCDLGLCVR